MTTARSRIVALTSSGVLAVAGLLGGAAVSNATPAVHACSNASVAVSATPSEGATGHGSLVLLFRNVGTKTCSLHGYPGVDALNAKRHTIAHATRTLHGFAGGAKSVATVTVAPGHTVSATVEWLNFNPSTSGNCAFSTYVAATPANTPRSTLLAASVSVCRLQVHPTVAGTSGHNNFVAAQTEWLRGAKASSAKAPAYWTSAEHHLLATGDQYPDAAATLHKLIALPDADQTPAQNAQYRKDVAALDRFFGTPHLYS